MPLVAERINKLTEAVDMLGFLLRRRGRLRATVDARVDEAGLGVVKAAHDALAGLPEWTTTAIEEALRVALVEELGLKPRNAFGPVRIAVTGRKVSPPLFESLELLGRDRSLAPSRRGPGVSEPAMTSPAAGPAYDGPRGLPYHLVLLGGRPGWWRFRRRASRPSRPG